mmetsp:Transcript_86840/g.268897  ORF Transcript_86840/g.268897 Transcript_86840/m.268897 type:complete len:232 (-) Transcript_86840:627-1322(-)
MAPPCGGRKEGRTAPRMCADSAASAPSPSGSCTCQESAALWSRKTGVVTKGSATLTRRQRQPRPRSRQAGGRFLERFVWVKSHSNCGKASTPAGSASDHAGKMPLSESTATKTRPPRTRASKRARSMSASRTDATPPALQPEMTTSLAESRPWRSSRASSTASTPGSPRKCSSVPLKSSGASTPLMKSAPSQFLRITRFQSCIRGFTDASPDKKPRSCSFRVGRSSLELPW